MNNVYCSSCGLERPRELTTTTERPPCSQCGGTALTINLAIDEAVFAKTNLGSEIVPGSQKRDWKQRWQVLQGDLEVISAPCTDVMSSNTIHTALQRLCSFFIQAYHLKDALKEAAPELGLRGTDIEDAITLDPRLALLADLANLDKHLTLTRQPRSGFTPVIKTFSGVDDPSGHGWNLSAKIAHGNELLDGVSAAKQATDAWREKLSMWGIV
jgi:hypothetical protein